MLEGRMVRWTGWSHPGRFRKQNEDAFVALTFDAREVAYLGREGEARLDQRDFVFAVSDGMGGAKAGEFASKIAVQKITELMPGSFRLGAAGLHEGRTDFLEELVDRIHREMIWQSQFYEECRGMGATLSLCWISPAGGTFSHVGDSRIYFLPKDGGIRQITEDHTHVGWLVRTGQITASEARFHPKKHLLQRALGGKERHVEAQVGTIKLEPGDRLILCTDGLNEGISDRVMESLVREPGQRLAHLIASDRLIQESMENSGRDNLTAVVIEVDDPGEEAS